MKISEINITPIKPQNGIVAFCSFVLADSLYLGSVALMTRPDGSYRACYPTKKIGVKNINIFHPISREFGEAILGVLVKEYENLIKINEA